MNWVASCWMLQDYIVENISDCCFTTICHRAMLFSLYVALWNSDCISRFQENRLGTNFDPKSSALPLRHADDGLCRKINFNANRWFLRMTWLNKLTNRQRYNLSMDIMYKQKTLIIPYVIISTMGASSFLRIVGVL